MDDPKPRTKLAALLSIEDEVQQWWQTEHAFEEDAPIDEKREKYLVTFPYPYVNGRFHLGHAFTVTKAEFAVSYQKLKGKQAIFPFGMHCTGMPIKAAADKIKHELEEFGNPPQFPVEDRFRGHNWAKDKAWLTIENELKQKEKTQKRAKGKSQKEVEQELAKERDSSKRRYFHENIDATLSLTPPSAEEQKVEQVKEDPTAFHSKKTKAIQKSGDLRQWFIMLQLDISPEEIPRFADAAYWLKFFPPLYKKDLTDFGLKIDWRRTFITTDANPYYDSFVRWHFNTLRSLGKVKFDKRFSIYSPLDGQPCADHDRASGEGVLPFEYTLIKMQVPDDVVAARFPTLAGRKVFLAPATLRPETMYGQTNCWVLPEGEYGAFEINDTEVFFITERAARNLAFQGHSRVPEQVSCLLQVRGSDLIGLPLIAPLATVYPRVYVLPMLTVSTLKGTGVVTSVPSDSPDDYAALQDLQTKTPEWRASHGLQEEWVMPFAPVEIIHVPSIGANNEPTNNAAKLMVEQLKIKSQKDRVLLDQAKKEVYKQGFYNGTLLVGEYSGKPVQEAKPLVREHLLSTSQAIKYCEPESPVTSRSGDDCLVALTDQWYLSYGEPSWRADVEKALKQLETYNDECRSRFEYTVNWLEQWACSRSYGLGTKLPWDEQFLIESLSDSTIYMAYYSVAHILHAGEVDPEKLTPEALASNPNIVIQPEQMTHEVWEFLFRNGPEPETAIPKELLHRMRNEFLHWYPVDLRVSGNDLINNHLTFFLYNHCAIFPESQWPRAVRTNGYIMLDGEKMSKSKGNFMTLRDAIDSFGRDATRFALADAGDGMDDANFTEETANAAILRLHTQLEWTKETLESFDRLRDEEIESFADQWFDNEINATIHETDHHYERTNFREALQTGFFGLQKVRDTYRMLVGSKGLNRRLVRRFIEVQAILLAPICPHYCEHIWRTLLGNKSSVTSTSWPKAAPTNPIIRKQGACLTDNAHEFTKTLAYSMKRSKKPISRAVIYTARCHPEFNREIIMSVRELYEQSKTFPETPAVFRELVKKFDEKTVKSKAMKFVVVLNELFELSGADAFSLDALFNEHQLFTDNVEFIQAILNVTFPIEVIGLNDDNSVPEGHTDLRKEKNTMPGRPSPIFIA